jgi:hypothetical protein
VEKWASWVWSPCTVQVLNTRTAYVGRPEIDYLCTLRTCPGGMYMYVGSSFVNLTRAAEHLVYSTLLSSQICLWTHFFDFFFNVIKFIMFVLSCLYLAMYVVKMNPTRDIEHIFTTIPVPLLYSCTIKHILCPCLDILRYRISHRKCTAPPRKEVPTAR